MVFDTESLTSIRNRHPEDETYASFFARQAIDAIFRPIVRLKVQFPWGLKDFTRIYAVAVVWYVVCSILPLLLIFGAIYAALQIAPTEVLPMVADDEGHPNATVILMATVTSFICGFGAELFYFNRQLNKSGTSLLKIVGFNLATLSGSWGEAFKRSSMALVIAVGIQQLMDFLPLPHPHQQTADMASHLTGVGFLGFGVLAAVLAPLFEEIIFRGCVFNAFRNIFREGKLFKLLQQKQRVADYMAVVVSAAIFAGAHMDLAAFPQLFVLGVILAELYRRTGSLICPIMLHAMNNLVATMLIAMK